jgi:putative flippase GtrA
MRQVGIGILVLSSVLAFVNVQRVRLVLTGLLGVVIALSTYWIFHDRPAWVGPWVATVALLLVALLVWAILDYQRRRQGG